MLRDYSGDPENGEDSEIDIERRENAQGAAGIEALEGDCTGAVVFAEQQCGDEIAADDEEDLYAVEAASDDVAKEAGVRDGRGQERSGVREDNDSDGESAEAVEGWDVVRGMRLRWSGLNWLGTRGCGSHAPMLGRARLEIVSEK